MAEKEQIDRKPLVFGVVLVVAGLSMMVAKLDIAPLDQLWQFWPLIPVAIGSIILVTGPDAQSLTKGLWLIGLGGWFLVANLGLFGFDWANSWPLVIILSGVVTIIAPNPGDRACAGLTDRLDGVGPLLVGLWLLATTHHLFGFGWSTSWPLLLVLIGVSTLLKASAALVRPGKAGSPS